MKNIFLLISMMPVLTISPRQPLPYVDPLLMPTIVLGGISAGSFALAAIAKHLEKRISSNILELPVNQEIPKTESAFVATMTCLGFFAWIGTTVLACEP